MFPKIFCLPSFLNDDFSGYQFYRLTCLFHFFYQHLQMSIHHLLNLICLIKRQLYLTCCPVGKILCVSLLWSHYRFIFIIAYQKFLFDIFKHLLSLSLALTHENLIYLFFSFSAWGLFILFDL